MAVLWVEMIREALAQEPGEMQAALLLGLDADPEATTESTDEHDPLAPQPEGSDEASGPEVNEAEESDSTVEDPIVTVVPDQTDQESLEEVSKVDPDQVS